MVMIILGKHRRREEEPTVAGAISYWTSDLEAFQYSWLMVVGGWRRQKRQ